MYPRGELKELETRKAGLRSRIVAHRRECIESFAAASQPLQWVERVQLWWQQLSPFAKLAAVPVQAVLKKSLFRRRRVLHAAIRWAPAILKAIRATV